MTWNGGLFQPHKGGQNLGSAVFPTNPNTRIKVPHRASCIFGKKSDNTHSDCPPEPRVLTSDVPGYIRLPGILKAAVEHGF